MRKAGWVLSFATACMAVSLCSAQESADFRPASTNVWGAEYPRVDGAGRFTISPALIGVYEGDSVSFCVELSSAPGADVAIPISSSDPAEALVAVEREGIARVAPSAQAVALTASREALRRLAEKLGLRREGEGLTRSGEPMLIYRLRLDPSGSDPATRA